MKDLKKIRLINDIEKRIIIDSFSKYSINILTILKKLNLVLFISLNQNNSLNEYPNIFLINDSQKNLIKKFNKNTNISSVGLYFGFIKKENFHLSLEGAEFLYELGTFTENQCIYVDEKGERSILYGNDILSSMIATSLPNLKKNDLILIFNELKELIALGLSKIDYNSIENQMPKGVIALNLIDKGYYLRKN